MKQLFKNKVLSLIAVLLMVTGNCMAQQAKITKINTTCSEALKLTWAWVDYDSNGKLGQDEYVYFKRFDNPYIVFDFQNLGKVGNMIEIKFSEHKPKIFKNVTLIKVEDEDGVQYSIHDSEKNTIVTINSNPEDKYWNASIYNLSLME